jgi:hypothetical protein
MYTLTAHIPHKITKDVVIHTIHSYKWGSLITNGHVYSQDGMNFWIFDFDSLTPEGHRIYTMLKVKGVFHYTKVNDWQFSYSTA